ncbi:hypothetical protein Gotri_012577 [Gossypium trilobum]|uniref:Uncharacterized protein n=1 Tax=Gossypium trilobum TaxID=34281 RepID=A0A7J9DQL9_9ROSI|nr:hypothetical protein [Gossypium trilobum]
MERVMAYLLLDEGEEEGWRVELAGLDSSTDDGLCAFTGKKDFPLEWDLTIRATPRWAMVGSSCWLREEGAIFQMDDLGRSSRSGSLVNPADIQDFYHHITLGGRLCDERCVVDFRTILEEAGLFDLGFLVNGLLGNGANSHITIFVRDSIRVNLVNMEQRGNRTFQFEDAWLLEDSCEAEERLHSLLTADPTDDALDEMVLTRMHVNFEIDKAERYWEQWAWDNWLRHGDRNTIFFYRHVSHRHRVNAIDHIIVADRIMMFSSDPCVAPLLMAPQGGQPRDYLLKVLLARGEWKYGVLCMEMKRRKNERKNAYEMRDEGNE